MNSVAIQGIKGSYSEEAAREICGAARILECVKFEDAFYSLESGAANFAVIPFKNKIVGDIETPHLLLNKTKLRILDQLELKVNHLLAGTPNAEFENLKTVRSHVEALKQCRQFLSQNVCLQQITGADTASGIRRIIENDDPHDAAIGSRRAAEIYGAKILRENIADDADNWTTFYLIGN